MGNRKKQLLWLCFQAAEQQARFAKKGIWADFKPLKAAELSKKDVGYQYIIGEVTDLKETENSLKFILDANLTVKVDKKNINFFKTSGTKIQLHNSILLTGHLKWSANQLRLAIRHPAQILP